MARRPMVGDRHGRAYDFFNGDYYRDGYLFKEVTVTTYIDVENVKPLLNELRLFEAQANKVALALALALAPLEVPPAPLF